MCETAAPGARYRSAVYRGWQRYLAILFNEMGFADAGTRAHLVLALLDADLHRFLADEQAITPSAVRASIHAMLNSGGTALAAPRPR